MIPREHIQETLKHYFAKFPEEKSGLCLLEEQLASGEDMWSRKNFRGHVTASALILNEKHDAVLLVFHKVLQRYLQPGGHVEPEDDTLKAAALREAREETGMTHLIPFQEMPGPVFINSHPIPANDKKQEAAHVHHDFMFAFTASTEIVEANLEEVSGFQWIPVYEVLRDGDANVSKALRKMNLLINGFRFI